MSPPRRPLPRVLARDAFALAAERAPPPLRRARPQVIPRALVIRREPQLGLRVPHLPARHLRGVRFVVAAALAQGGDEAVTPRGVVPDVPLEHLVAECGFGAPQVERARAPQPVRPRVDVLRVRVEGAPREGQVQLQAPRAVVFVRAQRRGHEPRVVPHLVVLRVFLRHAIDVPELVAKRPRGGVVLIVVRVRVRGGGEELGEDAEPVVPDRVVGAVHGDDRLREREDAGGRLARREDRAERVRGVLVLGGVVDAHDRRARGLGLRDAGHVGPLGARRVGDVRAVGGGGRHRGGRGEGGRPGEVIRRPARGGIREECRYSSRRAEMTNLWAENISFRL